jgi:hypothetical protein
VKSSKIWTPDIIIFDSAEKNAPLSQNRASYLLRVSHQGTVRWQYQMMSSSFCQINIVAFPFDEQTCYINMRSSVRDKYSLRLKRRNAKVKVKENIRTEWFIYDSIVDETHLILSKEPNQESELSVLRFTLKLRRAVNYYVFKILFPFSLIAFITLFTFWLAPDSGEKLTLDVTILLSLVIYLQYMSEYIPRSTIELPIVTLFTLTNFFLVFLSCAATVLVLRCYHQNSLPSMHLHQLPYKLRVILFKYLARLLCFSIEFRPDDRETVKQKKFQRKREEQNCSAVISMDEDDDDARSSAEGNVKDKNLKAHNKGVNALKILRKLNGLLKEKQLKECFRIRMRNDSASDERSEVDELNENMKMDEENAKIYREEWKQAALIFDRLLFFIFLLSMCFTTSVFLRVNIFEYIISNKFELKDNIQPIKNEC